MYLLITTFILMFGVTRNHAEDVIVRVEQGVLRGEQKVTVTGDTVYYSFKGIPYAAPPTGRWRFMAPRPPLTWTGIRNATKHGHVCPQINGVQTMLFLPGSEDCLFLNVYSPCLDPESPLAVMVYIHGGGYSFGSGNDDYYGPDFLMNSKNVILVTINYRLDTLGFLCLDIKEVPGNAGMKDQVAALKWIQTNIKSFGGDPKKVTLVGESAGAVSCALHAVSPMSRGLFHRIIPMSSGPFNEFNTEFEQTRRAYILGNNLGFKTTNPKALLQYLQTVPVRQLLNTNVSVIAAENYMHFLVKGYYLVPVVEKKLGQEPFLAESFEVLIKRGLHEADTLLGHASKEGLFVISYYENGPTFENFKRNPEVLLPRTLLYNSTPRTYMTLADLIQEFYTGSRLTPLDTVQQLVNYFTDVFTYPIFRYARRLSNFNRNDNIYMYQFASVSNRNVLSQEGARYGLDGVSHTEDLRYLFHPNALNLPIDENSSKLIKQFVALLTNFAIFGKPTPDSSFIWPKYTTSSEKYVVVGQNLTMAAHPSPAMVNFWEYIFHLAGQKF
ncbi:esterase FE4-like [Bicyclus anynana]|uniref:Carboxylic ester hydrolase n=1 Tax=Bicyclus anynana TaxID=110368 RepID=A0A6J1PA76_BICAN|nr:esterase FE4-like [Bicyclus anynana]